MARISAHGTIVGTIYLTVSAKRYMSDGMVLRNAGFGWKKSGKVKPGLTVEDAYARAAKYHGEILADRPSYAAYRKALHEMAGLSKRWKLHSAVGLMPDDADGVWSEVCDGYGDNVSADIDEVSNLCMLYRNSVAEQAARIVAAFTA